MPLGTNPSVMVNPRAVRTALENLLISAQLGGCFWTQPARAQDPLEEPICTKSDEGELVNCDPSSATGGEESGTDLGFSDLGSFDETDLEHTDGLWLDSWHWDWDPEWSVAWLPQSPSWALSVAAGRRTFHDVPVLGVETPQGGAQEWFGLLTLRLPFDELTSAGVPSRGPSPASRGIQVEAGLLQHVRKRKAESRGVEVMAGVVFPAVSEEDPPPPGEAALQGTPPARGPGGVSPSIRPAPSDSDESTSAQWERNYLVLLRKTIEMTERGFERSGEGRRFSSMVRRSRSSGLVPELRLRGVVGFDRTTSSEDVLGVYPGETSTRGGRDSLLEARLTFHLDRLVLGAQEPAVERQRVQWQKQRAEHVQAAVETVAEWLKLAVKMRHGELDLEERLDLVEEQFRVLARAHWLTWGWFEGERTLSRLGLNLDAAVGTLAPLSPDVDVYRRRTEGP